MSRTRRLRTRPSHSCPVICARLALEAGLVDHIVVHLAPILLGDGVRLFERAGPPVKLERTSVAGSGQVTDLWFRVLKDE
jgi:riboflavin biosynthesis pyrimidine reductase